MGVTTTQTNKPFSPRGNDQSPLAFNRAKLFSGKALDFDGVNDYVDCGTLDVTAYTQMSVSFYMNVDTTTQDFRLISIRYSGADDIRIFHSVSIGGGILNFSLDDGDVDNIGVNFETNQWYHVVMTHDGTTLKAYFNGVEQASTASTFDYANADGLFYVGRYTGGDVTFYDGEASNAKIFNTALTAAQVADLYNNPEKVVPTGVDNTALKLWLPMQEGAGTTAYDGSGNGNHGTISGATYTHGIGAPVSQTAVIDWNKGVNSFTYSEDFSNAAWLTIDTTKVSTSETDYIGGTTAANITWLAGSPRYFYQNKNVSGASTLSFYVKSNGGGNKFRLFANATGVVSSDFTATNEWIRYSYNFTGNGANGIGIIQASDNSAADLLVCFAQVETNATAGPYVPTIATAQTSPVLLPQGLTTGRDITGVNLFENVRKQGALNLDGNSWAEVHDNESLDVTDAISVECWVYWDGASDKGILSKYDYYNSQRSYLLYQDTSTVVRFYASSNGIAQISVVANTTFADGNWYHLVGVYDGAELIIYVNGAEDNTLAYTSGIFSSDNVLEIGRYGQSANAAHEYSGPIAQPRIYNRALTAEEVQRNYNAGKNIYTN